MIAALLDRVTHIAHIINCSWQSYRLSETLKTRKDNLFAPNKKKWEPINLGGDLIGCNSGAEWFLVKDIYE